MAKQTTSKVVETPSPSHGYAQQKSMLRSSSKNNVGTTSSTSLNNGTKYNGAVNSNQKSRSPNGAFTSGDKRMSDATKKHVADGVARAKLSATKASPGSSNNEPQFETLEQEIEENPDLVYNPIKIRKLLLVKIGQLGETIRRVQSNNFQIEDDVLEKLRLLKSFNDKLQQVSVQSAQQARQLKDSLAQSQDERAQIVHEKTQRNDRLTDKLIGMETELTQLRIKADQVQTTANGLVVNNVEELSIDLNRQSNVDKQPLAELKVKKAEITG